MADRTPTGLGAGGKALWREITSEHTLDVTQRVQLEEACRAKDRLDKLDELLRGDVDTWASLTHRTRTEDYELKIDDALGKANTTANLMKQLIASLRLPDEQSGKRPQQRGAARGSYRTSGDDSKSSSKSGGKSKVSSLDRARQRKSS